MSNEDIVGSTAKLEALRQNALMRHQIRSEGVLDGGRTAGRMVGTPVGSIGGMAALLSLMGKSLGTKGKIGAGLTGAIGGGFMGRAFGSAAGGITAGTAIPKLPPHMQTPVTPGSSNAVAATLAKAASDEYLIYRMEKTAARIPGRIPGWDSFRNWLSNLRTPSTKPTTPPPQMHAPETPQAPAMPPPSGAPRPSVPEATSHTGNVNASDLPFAEPIQRAGGMGAGAKTLLGGGAALGTAFTGGHLYNDAQNTVGRSLNPLTWFNPSERWYNEHKPELYARYAEIFKRNSQAADTASARLRAEMESARASGNMDWYNKLNERLIKGDFRERVSLWNIPQYRVGGLNPFAPEHGSTLQSRMLEQQKALRGHLDAALRTTMKQPGDEAMAASLQKQLASPDLLPRQAEALQRQLETLQSRIKSPGDPNADALALQQRMIAAGMHVPPLVPGKPAIPGTTPGVTPYSSGWNMGGRTRSPGYATGASMMPAEFRPYQQAYDFVPPPSPKPTQHQGDF